MESLFRDIADQLGAELAGVTRLTGGSSATVHALDLAFGAAGDRRVVVRQHGSAQFKQHHASVAAKEFFVTSAVRDHGCQVPEPLLHNPGQNWLVTAWIDGASADDVDEAMLDQMVDFLHTLHAIDIAGSVDLGDALDLLESLEDPIAALPRYLPDTEQGRALGEALDDGRVPPPTNEAVLIHGDYWPGNILWNEDRLAAVIDWEDAALGDPLADLACARVELVCQYDAVAMTQFTERYVRATKIDVNALAVWEAYVAASAMATMHLWNITAAEEQRRRAETNRFFNHAVDQLLAKDSPAGPATSLYPNIAP